MTLYEHIIDTYNEKASKTLKKILREEYGFSTCETLKGTLLGDIRAVKDYPLETHAISQASIILRKYGETLINQISTGRFQGVARLPRGVKK